MGWMKKLFLDAAEQHGEDDIDSDYEAWRASLLPDPADPPDTSGA
jgi:hypothetical protein